MIRWNKSVQKINKQKIAIFENEIVKIGALYLYE